MSHGFKHKAINAAVWRTADTFCQNVGTLVVNVILARLLLPEAFGAVALLVIFISLGEVIINTGFSTALIQRQNTTEIEESSVHYCNIMMATLLYGAFYFIAPLVPLFYNKPELTVLCPLLRVSALTLIIGSFGQVRSTLLVKQLHFKPLFVAGFVSVLVRAIVGITLALQGYGVWALAWSTISYAIIRAVLICWFSFWRPLLKFSFAALAPLFNFGWKLLLSGIVHMLFIQIYGLLIGRFYTPVDLAFFNRGKQFPSIFAMSLTASISAVLFPALSLVQKEPAKMRKLLERSLQIGCFLSWPCLVGMALVAKLFIRLVLTEKWLPAAPYLQIVSLTMCLYPVYLLNAQVITAKGRSGLALILEVFTKILLVGMLIVVFPHGIKAILYGQLVWSIVSLLIYTHFTKRLIGYSLWEQLVAVRSTISATIAMVIGVLFVGMFSVDNVIVNLGVQVLTGAFIYLTIAHLISNTAYLELRDVVVTRLRISGAK